MNMFWKRSEFWLSLAATIGGFLQTQNADPISQICGSILIAIGAGTYTHGRAKVKASGREPKND